MRSNNRTRCTSELHRGKHTFCKGRHRREGCRPGRAGSAYLPSLQRWRPLKTELAVLLRGAGETSGIQKGGCPTGHLDRELLLKRPGHLQAVTSQPLSGTVPRRHWACCLGAPTTHTHTRLSPHPKHPSGLGSNATAARGKRSRSPRHAPPANTPCNSLLPPPPLAPLPDEPQKDGEARWLVPWCLPRPLRTVPGTEQELKNCFLNE